MEAGTAGPIRAPIDLHRRNLGQNQHDTHPRTITGGRASGGQDWKTTTLIAALCTRGIHCSTVVDGAVNADVFQAFVQQVLVPQLRSGDVIVMDNLSSHKTARTRQLIESAGATLVSLPPYSPDLNPIEMIFAKIKQLLRSVACRTADALWSSMQQVLNQVSASDSANCFRHCGYTLQLD